MTALNHGGSFQPKHWICNSTQILPEINLSTLGANLKDTVHFVFNTFFFVFVLLAVHFVNMQKEKEHQSRYTNLTLKKKIIITTEH